MLTLAEDNNIRNPEGIINDVLKVVGKWMGYAAEYKIEKTLAKAIDITLF